MEKPREERSRISRDRIVILEVKDKVVEIKPLSAEEIEDIYAMPNLRVKGSSPEIPLIEVILTGSLWEERLKTLTSFLLMGNIGSHTLHSGSVEDVRAEALSCLKEAKKSRGIVVGVSNFIVPETPKENIIALIETIRKHRKI